MGIPRDFKRDLYHWLLGRPWWQIVLMLWLAYGGLSLAFACLYLLGGDCVLGAHPGSLKDYFFFSVQTLATIGYGAMNPQGDYANFLVSIEAFCGLLVFALMTGLLFAKFSVPNARVLFSQKVVVGRRDGRPALMFRMANARGNDILEAQFHLTLSRIEPMEGDPRYRRFLRLPLVVSESPLFILTFQAAHIIDESSPLYGVTAEEMKAQEYSFSITLIGLDGLLSQTVHARHNYDAKELVWDHRFADTLTPLPDGTMQLDYRRFHEVVPYADQEAPPDLQDSNATG